MTMYWLGIFMLGAIVMTDAEDVTCASVNTTLSEIDTNIKTLHRAQDDIYETMDTLKQVLGTITDDVKAETLKYEQPLNADHCADEPIKIIDAANKDAIAAIQLHVNLVDEAVNKYTLYNTDLQNQFKVNCSNFTPDQKCDPDLAKLIDSNFTSIKTEVTNQGHNMVDAKKDEMKVEPEATSKILESAQNIFVCLLADKLNSNNQTLVSLNESLYSNNHQVDVNVKNLYSSFNVSYARFIDILDTIKDYNSKHNNKSTAACRVALDPLKDSEKARQQCYDNFKDIQVTMNNFVNKTIPEILDLKTNVDMCPDVGCIDGNLTSFGDIQNSIDALKLKVDKDTNKIVDDVTVAAEEKFSKDINETLACFLEAITGGCGPSINVTNFFYIILVTVLTLLNS